MVAYSLRLETGTNFSSLPPVTIMMIRFATLESMVDFGLTPVAWLTTKPNSLSPTMLPLLGPASFAA